MNKKTITVTLGIVLLLSAVLLSAAGQNEGTVETEARMEITWMGRNPPGFPINISEETSEIKRAIEDRFNVVLKPVEFDYSNKEQFNLFWASGNTVDGMSVAGGEYSNIAVLVEQDHLRDVKEDWVRQYLPVWMKKVESLVGEELTQSALHFQDKVYKIPFANYAAAQPYIVGIRQDWMRNVGVSELPTTLDGFTDLMRRFVQDDPDGNGKDDTYGLHPRNWQYGFNTLFGAFGIMPGSYYPIDGKIVYTSAIREYKEALTIAQSWYREGMIDPEFVTDSRDIQRKKWSEGKFGVLGAHPWWFAGTTNPSLTSMVTDKNPDASIVFTPPVTGPYGKAGYYIAYPNLKGGFAFGKQASDEKVKKIMQMLEATATDWEFYVSTAYGKEGFHYNIVDGIIIPDPEKRDGETTSKWGLGYFFPTPVDFVDFEKITPKIDLAAYGVSMASPKAYVGVAFPFGGVNEARTIKGADMQKVTDEFYYNAVTGKIDIDAEWEQYLKDLERSGLGEILAEYQAAYDSQ